MTPDQKRQLDTHVQAIAQLLYNDAQGKGLSVDSLRDIEQTVRVQLQEHVSPEVGNFLCKQLVQSLASDPDA